MKYPVLASAAIRFVERIPTAVWAVWILAVVLVTGFMAMHNGGVVG